MACNCTGRCHIYGSCGGGYKGNWPTYWNSPGEYQLRQEPLSYTDFEALAQLVAEILAEEDIKDNNDNP